jgi:hypothetical protein
MVPDTGLESGSSAAEDGADLRATLGCPRQRTHRAPQPKTTPPPATAAAEDGAAPPPPPMQRSMTLELAWHMRCFQARSEWSPGAGTPQVMCQTSMAWCSGAGHRIAQARCFWYSVHAASHDVFKRIFNVTLDLVCRTCLSKHVINW